MDYFHPSLSRVAFNLAFTVGALEGILPIYLAKISLARSAVLLMARAPYLLQHQMLLSQNLDMWKLAVQDNQLEPIAKLTHLQSCGTLSDKITYTVARPLLLVVTTLGTGVGFEPTASRL